MVCIAAFIILCILSVFVAVLSIFKRELGKKYWKVFKKSWGCVGKKVTLQKCETNFKDDVKNTLLAKVVIKKPKLVKPLGIAIEVASVLIVAITIWSLAVAIKSGLALWTFGTCDVTKPSSCSLGAEVCSIDQEGAKNPVEAVGLWFSEWGEIFIAIPDKLKTWSAEDYGAKDLPVYGGAFDDNKSLALDILDPGCLVCMQSFKNQLSAGFMDDHAVALLLYPIQNPDGSYKFKNSGIIAKYLLASEIYATQNPDTYGFNSWDIISKIFTEYNDEHIIYQNLFNEVFSEDEAATQLQSWILGAGFDESDVVKITTLVDSPEVAQKMAENKTIVDEKINAKGIPTLIYDGKKHTGLFKSE